MNKWLAVVLFCAGLFICLYPLAAKVYYNYDMSQESDALNKHFQVDSDDQKNRYMQFEQYNRQMTMNQTIEAPAVQVKKNDSDDEQMISDDVIATVKIPKLNLHYPVYDKATPENLNRGVSRVEGTSYPVGGRSTNSVLAAHSYSPYHEWFTHIDRLENGDQVIINNFKETLYYKVYDRVIVTPDKVEAMAVRQGKDVLTLLTCTPSGAERLLIYAERTTKDGKKVTPQPVLPQPMVEKSIWEKMKVLSDSWVVIAAAALLSFLFIVMLIRQKES
ncbi:class C sortase [Macrococcus equipercicus]|uniref:Class C sortase n=1 Tax=Macrococcus equipercicus TaxID=69967 RepID=A0A9Q9BME6_9STAP|nr:class C sortase [Macrococcus equipercicus]UTH14223.1 class C sortase [Macrococcus equipercicus]